MPFNKGCPKLFFLVETKTAKDFYQEQGRSNSDTQLMETVKTHDKFNLLSTLIYSSESFILERIFPSLTDLAKTLLGEL